MGRKFALIFVFWMVSVATVLAHPYHTSLAEVRYNSKNQTLEIALKVFADDLEKTLSETAKKPVTINQTPAVQAMVAAYLKKMLAAELGNKQALPLKYLGSEPENNTHWLYLEIPIKPGNLKSFTLRNELLLATFPDQVNIMNLDINGQKKTLLFRQDDFRKQLNF
jgi:hypothetical protein